jgi:catechol 2,3-dioxygenase
MSAAPVYFKPRRLGHVNLWVDDLASSERFYSESCGLRVEFTEPDLVATFLGTGQTPHDLGMIEKTNGVDRYGRDGILQLPGTIGRDAGLNHLAWELENERDLVDGYKQLLANNIETDITVDHQVAHSVYMFDPDGNYNEFYCDTVQNWREVLHGEMDLITSHWDPLGAEPFTQGRYETNPEWHCEDGAPLQPRRVTHAVMQTPDVARLVDFYTTIAGLREVSREEGVSYLGGSLDGYDYNLVLVPGPAAAYGHASFELADEAALDGAVAALAAAGVTVAAEVALPWKRSIFLCDPDGLESEWSVPRTGARDLARRGDIDLIRAV